MLLPLYLISQAPLEDRHRAASALWSPSKSNDVLPDGTGGGGAGIAARSVEKNPKNDLNESPIENRIAVAGETGFAISKPSGSCGVLNRSTAVVKLFAAEALSVKIVEVNLAVKLSEGKTVKGSGGSALGADICRSDEFILPREAAALFVQPPSRNVGISSKRIKSPLVSRIIKLSPNLCEMLLGKTGIANFARLLNVFIISSSSGYSRLNSEIINGLISFAIIRKRKTPNDIVSQKIRSRFRFNRKLVKKSLQLFSTKAVGNFIP